MRKTTSVMTDKTLHGLLSSLPVHKNIPLAKLTAARRKHLPAAYAEGLVSLINVRDERRQLVALTPEGIRRRRSLTEKIHVAENYGKAAQK